MTVNYARCKKAFDKGWIDATGLKVWVDPTAKDPEKITTVEYKQITGLDYVA